MKKRRAKTKDRTTSSVLSFTSPLLSMVVVLLLFNSCCCNGQQTQLGTETDKEEPLATYNYNDTIILPLVSSANNETTSALSSTFVGGFEGGSDLGTGNDTSFTAITTPTGSGTNTAASATTTTIMNLQSLGDSPQTQGGASAEDLLQSTSYGPIDQVRNFLNSSSNLDGITEYIDLLDLTLDFIDTQLESNSSDALLESFNAFLLNEDGGSLLTDETLYMNYTQILEGLDEKTRLEIEMASHFLTESRCQFPLSGNFDRSFDDWMFYLGRRAEEYKQETEQQSLGSIGIGAGATQTDIVSQERGQEDEMTLPWMTFPIFCKNETVTIPSWLGQYDWMNDMITSLAVSVGVTPMGSLPESIGNLTNLQSIVLSDGKVTGKIPTTIGQLQHLTLLRLNRNQLEGSIPSELGNSSKLADLDLSSNQLTGSIPDSIANLTDLRRGSFEVRDNELTGTLSPALLAMREEMGSRFQIQGNPLNSQYVLVSPPPGLAGWEIAIIVVAVGLATALLVLSVTWSVRRARRAKSSKSSIIQMEDLFHESEKDLAMFCINRKDLKLMKLVGRGTYGSVFEAKWKDTPVAVKIMNVVDPHMHSREESRKYIETFEKEVEYLSQVNHKNIVKLFGYSLASPHVYIVQELMQMNLNQLTHAKDYKPDDVQILKIIEDIAHGLSYLHPRIVHCDLKPQNILLGANGEAKIADFGISKRKQGTFIQFTTTTHVPGSVIYMAPECFNAPQEISEKCDVFSLAMIMWECYTGVEPWDELPTPLSVVNAVAVQDRRPCIPVKIPPKMSRLIKKCWCTDSRKRPSCAEIAKLCQLMREDILLERTSSLSSPPSHSIDIGRSETV